MTCPHLLAKLGHKVKVPLRVRRNHWNKGHWLLHLLSRKYTMQWHCLFIESYMNLECLKYSLTMKDKVNDFTPWYLVSTVSPDPAFDLYLSRFSTVVCCIVLKWPFSQSTNFGVLWFRGSTASNKDYFNYRILLNNSCVPMKPTWS